MVKHVSDNTGRFISRPHYEPHELDRECEHIINKLLRDRHGEIKFPITTDDLEVLIEEHAELDMYADLEKEYGPDIEGVTEFRKGQKPKVKISQKLSENPKMANRLRTTMTHEFGHVLFHAYLWELEYLNPRSKHNSNFLVSKKETPLRASKVDWMEWQAGYVCGAILMPASHLRKLAQKFFQADGIIGPVSVNNLKCACLIEDVSRIYMVSKEAARVRLSVLNLISENDNTSVFQQKFGK